MTTYLTGSVGPAVLEIAHRPNLGVLNAALEACGLRVLELVREHADLDGIEL